MCADTMCEVPRRQSVLKMRVHDYLYDPAFIVSGARDYARTAFKAAMSSAQMTIQPLYGNMFSEMLKFPRIQVVLHPNCRLPEHIDKSYDAYVERVKERGNVPVPDLNGKDRFKYIAFPKKMLNLKHVSPDFQPPTSIGIPSRPRNRGTQSVYRESSAQTIPWQPDAKPAPGCENTPEVLYLDKLEWGPGCPYRIGDLPADFHTTEIINKMRHARLWMAVAEKGVYPRWMKKRDEIITDVETKDWIFRETEIDELQSIRLELLHRLQADQRQKQTNKTSRKLAKLWFAKKSEMERKIDHIRKTRDREHRKLVAIHEGGGRGGQVARLRAARGSGPVCQAACDPASELHAPLLRHGYQARRRHAEIYYDPCLLSAEDHAAIAEPPAWLDTCQNLAKSCSGHHLPRNTMKLCERETKWSEQFLENLHNDLKKARLGASLTATAGPLHVLKPRKLETTPRPATPIVESVSDLDEGEHQAALLLQRIIRGRAVQCLMYEGRTRAAELTEELKTTHGLQKEDKIRIAREEAKAREFNARRTETEQKEDAIAALVDELCGGAMSAALDFLEKELRRLKEERRQHAFVLIALREKTMREAAEAGRRQKEERRRREHDEMFKQVLGVTQGTVDAYLKQIITEGVELAAEEDSVKAAMAQADEIDKSMAENSSISTAEQNELVAELVHQFLLPHTHQTAARHYITKVQNVKLEAARKTIFGLMDDAEIKEEICERCGRASSDECRCEVCPVTVEPVETVHRHDYRWKYTRLRPEKPLKSYDEKYPMSHEARQLLGALVEDAVVSSRNERAKKCAVLRDVKDIVKDRIDATGEARSFIDKAIDIATGVLTAPVKKSDYRHLMTRVVTDAMARSEPYPTVPCPKELPSEIRRLADEETARMDPYCHCEEDDMKIRFAVKPPEDLLPSELRQWEDLLRCKCDPPHPEELGIETEELAEDTDSSDELDMDGFIIEDSEGHEFKSDKTG